MKSLLLSLILLLTAAPALAGDTADVIIHGVTRHVPDNGHGTEVNPGIGLRFHDVAHIGAVGADVYRNSYYKPAVALHKDWRVFQDVDFMLGAVSGYHLRMWGISEGRADEVIPFAGLEWTPVEHVAVTIGPAWVNVGFRF